MFETTADPRDYASITDYYAAVQAELERAPYFAIVCWGRARGGAVKPYYRSLASAQRDAMRIAQAGSVDVGIIACDSRADALDADISTHTAYVNRY